VRDGSTGGTDGGAPGGDGADDGGCSCRAHPGRASAAPLVVLFWLARRARRRHLYRNLPGRKVNRWSEAVTSSGGTP
jgi:MYXO-CTERM domain-containing protein